jgi:hypothetical protein
MSDAETKGNRKEIPPVPKGVVSGTAGRQRSEPSGLVYSAAVVFYRGLKRTYRWYFVADPKGLRKTLRRAESLVFRRKPGPRKRHDPNIAAAARKRRTGAKWDDLYSTHIREYDRLSEHTKAYAEDGFRKQVNAYLKRHPSRKKSDSVTPRVGCDR